MDGRFERSAHSGVILLMSVCVLMALLIFSSASAGPAGDDTPGDGQAPSGLSDEPANATPSAERHTPPPTEGKASNAMANLPLSFEENLGQFDVRVIYAARHPGGTFFFTKDGMTAVFTRVMKEEKGAGDTPGGTPDKPPTAPPSKTGPTRPPDPDEENRRPPRSENFALKVHFDGASSDVSVKGRYALPGKVSYFRGNDPSKWVGGATTYEKVVYRGLYPGVDLAFFGQGGSLKKEFTVSPGADAKAVKLRYEGQDTLKLSDTGQLVIATPWGELLEETPVSWQIIDGKKQPVKVKFLLDEEGETVTFDAESYDKDLPLVIDPGLGLPQPCVRPQKSPLPIPAP